MSDLDELRRAARATIAAGSARFRARYTIDPPPGLDFTIAYTGVTDFRRTAAEVAMGPGHDELARKLAERWPWLDDGDEGDGEPARSVWSGDLSYWAIGARWEVTERGWRDPVQAVERVAEALDTARRGDRFAFIAPVDARTRLAGEAWLDVHGRIRRIEATPDRARRPRGRRRALPGRERFTLELWDFGLPVQIEIPDAEPPEHIGVREVAETAIDLWRRRRAYRRQ